ncbi:MAG: hypothetical protein DRI48_09605 [Chloroflexi bacterium]|nr:MAG: hypothetical protein DRI48_09605 [Chloroflexota bacterium]
MTQDSVSQFTRPGRALHVVLTGSILLYALVVELCAGQFAPFEGFAPEINANLMSLLRVVFVITGLAGLTLAAILLWRVHAVSSVAGAFAIAYAALDTVASYGLVLFLLGGQRLDFYNFAVPALVGQLLLWTQGEQWDELVAQEQAGPSLKR